MRLGKNKIWAFLLSLVMVISFVPATAFALDGSGTSEVPYQVGTEADLRQALADGADGMHIQLTADIVLANHLEINKSVTITGTNGADNREISNKIIFINGDDTTVNFVNVDFARTTGNCVFIIGQNQSQNIASAPTVSFESCNISSTSDNTNGTINLTGGSLTMTGCTVTGNPYGIILNGLLSGSPIQGALNRTLILNNTNVTSTNGKAIITNSGTKSGDTISVTGGMLSGWNALTFMGSGVETTLTDVTINCKNPYSTGQNNYGIIVFGAASGNENITGNSVTVNGGTISATGNNTSSSNEYIGSFYNTDNQLKFSGTVLNVSGNVTEAFFIYSQSTNADAPYNAYRPGNASPVVVEGVSYNGFLIENTGEKFINIYNSFNEALNAAEDGNTIVLGQDVTESTEISKDVVIDMNGKDASGIIPGDDSILVYSEDEQTVTQVAVNDLDDVLSIAEFGFKANAGDANAAINNALGNGAVSDCDDNTAYIILSNRIKGNLTLQITKGSEIVYTETLTDADSAKVFYFTFEQDGGSAATQPIAADEYAASLMANGTQIAAETLKIYEIQFAVDDAVTSGGYSMSTDADTVAKPSAPTKEGYVFTGWSEAVVDEVANTITFTAQWKEETVSPDPDQPTDPDEPSEGEDDSSTGGDQTGDTNVPETGDESNIAIWITVMLAAGAALIGLVFYSRKIKYSR